MINLSGALERFQEVRDDAERAYRREDDDTERKLLRTKVETLEAVAFALGLELEPFNPFPTREPR